MIPPRHILIFRFSSLGDVAMTVPVLQNLLQQHPQVELTVVSTAFHAPLFGGMDRLHFVAADLKGRHKGFTGLFRLYRELKSLRSFDAVADLHNVLRTQILRFFFTLNGTRWVAQDKGRREKKALTRSENKILQPLKSTFRRYADVFDALGLPVQLETESGLKPKPALPVFMQQEQATGKRMIGIAPFAQFERKTYPEEKMKEVVHMLVQHRDIKVYLLGGKNEVHLLQKWKTGIPELTVVAGSMSFEAELHFIANLDVVVSMDSANMHLASLYGVPVVSIWGATHPYAGFYGWGQDTSNAVQIELACRPCSVFGNKAGPRKDLACMQGIAPLYVYQKVMTLLER